MTVLIIYLVGLVLTALWAFVIDRKSVLEMKKSLPERDFNILCAITVAGVLVYPLVYGAMLGIVIGEKIRIYIEGRR